MKSRRSWNLFGLVTCVGLLGYALYSQFVMNLEPCPLCIFQRVGIAALGLVFLLAALHDPHGGGAKVYAGLIALAALVTISISARHVYIQHLPEGAVPSCGASLQYMLKVFDLSEVVRKVLTGSGECAKVTWTFLSLSMPSWVLMFAAMLGGFGVYNNSVRLRGRRLSQQIAE
jgi:disulfide bond formation protein DsbB